MNPTESTRPIPLTVAAENIPTELKQRNQWVTWQYEFRDKWTKPPYQVNGKVRASVTDSTTWGAFSLAVECRDVDGVGFVLTSGDEYVAVDIDHVFNPTTKEAEPWAVEIIQKMQSYTEFSPSKEGIRIFIKGALPGVTGRKKDKLEIYAAGRYVTVTGHKLKNSPITIEARQDEILWLFDRYFKEKEKPKAESNGSGGWNGSDERLIKKALAAKNGDKFKRLFEDGDTSDYKGDDSASDLALCMRLAFWTQVAAQIDRIFRRSKLMRDKWDEKHGERTYGTMTIEKALTGTTEHYTNHPYGVEDGRIVRWRTDREGKRYSEDLCNFDVRVNEEVILDDGAETTRAFVVEGSLDTGIKLPAVRIAASRFAGMTWVTESWGMRAVVRAGTGTKDYLREAIQRLSPEPKLRRIFTHTGWRVIDGQWIYLSGTSSNGNFEVDLGTELSRYKLPPVVEDPVSAMKLSVKLLQIAPLRITAPLWAACYRAPLVSAFAQDLSLWVEGKTGSMKSTLTALFQNHFGDFDRTHLPGAWASTANQLERRAFLLKDNIFVIDDCAPGALDHRELESKASRILRAQGNLSGRGRLKSDLSERPAFAPRGIIVSTGEQHPPGQSLLARTLILELDAVDINLELLTELQCKAGRLSHAMAGYITWLAPQMDNMPKLLRETFIGARARATSGAEHLRIPEASAHLWLGLQCGLNYARDIGAIDDTAKLLDKCWEAFLQIGKDQAVIVEDERPVKRFLNVLYTILIQGRGIIVEKPKKPPDPKPGVDFLGWYDDDFLYLLPEATFSAVVRFCRDTGEHFPIRQERLKRDLTKDGISKVDQGRLTATTWIDSHSKRVLQLDTKAIETLLDISGLTPNHRSHHFKMGERDAL